MSVHRPGTRLPTFSRRLALVTAIGVFAGASSRARAYEDQLTLGLAAGYGAAISDVVARDAVVVDAAASLGLGQAWSLRVRASYAFHPAEPSAHALLPGASLLYLIDVLEWVPYFGLGGGALVRFGGGDGTADVIAHALAGIDYLWTRELTLEFELRGHLNATSLDDDPAFVTATLGLLLMFDAD